ncbi:MAG: nitroreductase family protein [Clostridiales bacterium]|nr:nitroreductase family protein [Clostridiales bacterium]
MSVDYKEAIKTRRSNYEIGKDKILSEDKIIEILKHSLKHSPTFFNAQNGRAILLFEKEHDKLWAMVKESLRKIVPAEKFSSTDEKISSFNNGYGTVLFFEDVSIVKNLQERFPLYEANFPSWSTQSIGMLQYIVWTSLSAEGLGASLQHYNEVIDKEVRKTWNIPDSWKLISQMPFGNILTPAKEKEFLPLEDRLKIYKRR